MMMREVAREISYSSSARSLPGRALVRLLENATGRISLIRRATGYEEEVAAGRNFWEVIVERYGLSLNVTRGQLENIPSEGPLILIANHPYGILDGLMMGYILSRRRPEFRILAHAIFRKAEALEQVILPVDFSETPQAARVNIATRRAALEHLAEGGAVGIFPGGTVSTAARPFSPPMDPGWRSFTAKMIARSGATVVPVYFSGCNSRLFQLASHLHNNLRLALLINEFRARVDEPVNVAVGAPVPREELGQYAADPRKMMDFLRRRTYELSPEPLATLDYGFEFEERYKG